MGDHAEDILEGLVCEVCGEVIDEDEPGFPRKCEHCQKDTCEPKPASTRTP